MKSFADYTRPTSLDTIKVSLKTIPRVDKEFVI